MNSRFFLSILILIVLVSCSQRNRTVIRGSVSSCLPEEMVYIEELGKFNNILVDSVKLKKNGRFRSRLNIKTPGFYQMVFSSGPSLSLILFPGEQVTFRTDMDNFYAEKYIEGSPGSVRVNLLHDSLRFTIQALNEIRTAYTSIQNESTGDLTKITRLNKEFEDIKKAYKKYSVGFILDDLHSLANIAALYQEYAPGEFVFHSNKDIQFFKLVSDTLSKYHRDVRHVKILKENFQALHSDFNMRKIMQQVTPVSYDIPDLKLPDPRGNTVALSSLKGKVVLLTFWSVQQPESVRNAIELKKIYNTYNRMGFEIYQVSVDKSLNHWKKAIAFDEIPWVNVIDTTFPDSPVRALYNVHSLPANYLIDKQQNEIHAKNISPEALGKTLPYLINK